LNYWEGDPLLFVRLCLSESFEFAYPTCSVEDPFSLFSALVDVHQPKLSLNPLYPVSSSESSVTVPSPVNISLKRDLPQAAPELTATPTKRRHWTINRHSGRARAKDGDEEDAHTSLPPREHATTDYGSMSTLMADLTIQATPQNINDQPKLFDLLRDSIDGRAVSSASDTDPTEAAALNAQDYIWSLVYGGVDGLAYVRSLAEFIGNPSPSPSPSHSEAEGFPLENWVEDNIVNSITGGRHELVQKIVRQVTTKSDEPSDISEDIRRSLDVYPQQGDLIAALGSQIDIQNLVNRPLELAQAELEWSGAAFKHARRQQREASGTLTIDNPMSALVAPSSQDVTNDTDKDDHEVLDHALEYSRQRLLQLIQSDYVKKAQESTVEDPYTRDLRMNLLALSKRVPLQLLSVSSAML
jgi:bromodomain-containing protein 7/9